MSRLLLILYFLCAACGVVEQPKSARTVAAYEVPLPTAEDKARFLDLLEHEAIANGYHVDAATREELASQSEVSPISFGAAVWRGKDDDELMASAMDFQDHIGHVWITFPLGQNPERSTRFRKSLVSKIKKQWPETASLPIMPSGAIPVARDLLRTENGYVVNPSAAEKYNKPSN